MSRALLANYRNSHRSIAHQDALMSDYESMGLIDGVPGSLTIAEARKTFERISQTFMTDDEKDCLLDGLACAISNNIVGGVASSLYTEVLEARLDLVGNE
jgi:hypothetical protein